MNPKPTSDWTCDTHDTDDSSNSYRIEDLPVKLEKSTPLGIVHSIVSAAASSSNQKTQHTAYLVVLGLYFYLRSCKHNKYTGHCRTVQFRPLLEFVFFVGDTLLSPDAPIGSFQHATQIVITLKNQKNSIRGDTVSHFFSKSPEAYLVRAGVNTFLRLQEQGCDPSTAVSDYSTPQGLCSVSASSIIVVVRVECKRVGAARPGFALEDVGTHSL